MNPTSPFKVAADLVLRMTQSGDCEKELEAMAEELSQPLPQFIQRCVRKIFSTIATNRPELSELICVDSMSSKTAWGCNRTQIRFADVALASSMSAEVSEDNPNVYLTVAFDERDQVPTEIFVDLARTASAEKCQQVMKTYSQTYPTLDENVGERALIELVVRSLTEGMGYKLAVASVHEEEDGHRLVTIFVNQNHEYQILKMVHHQSVLARGQAERVKDSVLNSLLTKK